MVPVCTFLARSVSWQGGERQKWQPELSSGSTRTRATGSSPPLNLDGSLQRSARAFPTLWRLATEYFFLRKLAPGSGVLNRFYEGGFDHDEAREVEWLFGACLLVRRDAADEVGLFDEDFFMFSEETDWCFRFRQAGWTVWFFPGADVVHLGGASHGGHLFAENVRGHLRFLAKHRGLREVPGDSGGICPSGACNQVVHSFIGLESHRCRACPYQ